MAKAPSKTDEPTDGKIAVETTTTGNTIMLAENTTDSGILTTGVENAVATINAAGSGELVTAENYDFASDAGSTQDMSQTDLKLPFIKIVQDLTPEADKKKAEYIQGCESGMMIDSNTKELISGDQGILFIPFAFTHDVTEWKPKRGGLAALHGKDESLFKQARRNDLNEDVLPNGNTLLLSYVYYGLRVHEDEQITSPAVLAYSKTAIKHARAWNTTLTTGRVKMGGKVFVPAYFFHAYRITVGMESGDGNTWYVPKIKIECQTIELGKRFALIDGLETYNEAKSMREMWERGAVQADMSQMANQAAGEAGAGNVPF